MATVTYTGPLTRGLLNLPSSGRRVPFVAGEPLEVTEAEAKTLDADEWSTPRTHTKPKPKSKAEQADSQESAP